MKSHEVEMDIVLGATGGDASQKDKTAQDDAPKYQLTEAQKKRARDIANACNTNNTSDVLNFGADVQTEMAGFADSILAQTRTGDLDELGSDLIAIVSEAEGIDIKSLEDQPWYKEIINRIPFVGKGAKRLEAFTQQFNSIKDHIDKTCEKMNMAQSNLHERIGQLDELYHRNNEQYEQLSVYIEAAKIKVDDITNGELADLQAELEKTNDPMVAQQIKDVSDIIHRFEKRISDLEVTRASVLQSAPQIKILQNNAATLIENIQTSMTSIIPNWKKQFVLAISLNEQKSAAELNDLLYETNNSMTRKNADMLGETVTQVAKQAQRSVIDVETLQHSHTKLIDMLNNVARIQNEGSANRKRLSHEIKTLENNLTKSLASQNTQAALGHGQTARLSDSSTK